MSRLSILVNCIILCVVFRGTFSMLKKIAVLKINKTENILMDDTSCSCDRNPLKVYWDKLHTRNVNVHGTVCACNLGMRGKPPRRDYIYAPGIGYHKMHNGGETWNKARKICNDEGGHLAIVNTDQEARTLSRLFTIYAPVQNAQRNDTFFLGIHDFYSDGEWTTVLGDSQADSSFNAWTRSSDRQQDNTVGPKNCGGYIVTNGFMVALNCNTRYAFFCEIPEITPF